MEAKCITYQYNESSVFWNTLKFIKERNFPHQVHASGVSVYVVHTFMYERKKKSALERNAGNGVVLLCMGLKFLSFVTTDCRPCTQYPAIEMKVLGLSLQLLKNGKFLFQKIAWCGPCWTKLLLFSGSLTVNVVWNRLIFLFILIIDSYFLVIIVFFFFFLSFF